MPPYRFPSEDPLDFHTCTVCTNETDDPYTCARCGALVCIHCFQEDTELCSDCSAKITYGIDIDMSLKKAIEHGKEKRKPYYGSKAFDHTCRPHGSCGYCAANRNTSTKRRIQKAGKPVEDA